MITISIFSFVSSPFYGTHYMHDSSMFEIIGKGWGKGLLPYRDLWDSKGPYVFFINMVGYFCGGKLGLFLLEIINIWITKWWIFKIFRMSLNKLPSLILTMLSVIIFAPIYWYYGNNQAEWCLPFLAASMYYIYSFAISEKNEHSIKGGFVYGITVGISIMSRFTNCIFVALCSLFILVWLINKKSWKNIWQNILAGALGILVVVLPFTLYFVINGAFYDMFYATFLYNLKYVQDGYFVEGISFYLVRVIIYSPFMLLNLYLLVKHAIHKEFKKILIWLIPLNLSFLYIEFLTYAFLHYFLIFLPFGVTIVTDFIKEKNSILAKVAPIVFLVLHGFACTYSIMLPEFWPDTPFIDQQFIVSEFMSKIPKNASFLAINEPKQHTSYLKYNFLPNNKYFYFQEICANIDKNIKSDILNDFKNNMPDYILFSDGLYISLTTKMPTIKESIYSPFFDQYYNIIDYRAINDSSNIINIYLLKLKTAN